MTSNGVGPPAAWTTVRRYATVPQQDIRWARTRQPGAGYGAKEEVALGGRREVDAPPRIEIVRVDVARG